MKKIFLIILIVILLVASIGINKTKKFINNIQLKSYELGIGTMIEHNFYSEHYLYGYKDGKLVLIGNKFKSNLEDFYHVYKYEDEISYFDISTITKMANDNENYYVGEDVTYEKNKLAKFKHYYEEYNYNEKEKKIFDMMMEDVNEENKDKYIYFNFYIVNDKGYFLNAYVSDKNTTSSFTSNNNVYKYNEEENITQLLFSLPSNMNLYYFK